MPLLSTKARQEKIGQPAVEAKLTNERANLLANVAELYYHQEKTQDEIAAIVNVTRSMVSRLLTEARQRNIVEVRIHRPLQFDQKLEETLVEHFGLKAARVINFAGSEREALLRALGQAGAEMLWPHLRPGIVLGVAWGSTSSAVVDQLLVEQPVPLKIVQLVGALGTQNKEYDGHGLVLRLADKLQGEAHYLNAPFICSGKEIAESLLNTPGIRETVELGRRSDVALLGVGSTAPQYSSFYLAGYVPLEELNQLIKANAVGDVCGLHFDVKGSEICADFCDRLVTIRKDTLHQIPVRVGVAGGMGKAQAILGALRGGYINILVSDNQTVRKVLELSRQI